MFYTYVLTSLRNRAYYIGSCQNIQKRVSQHNSGLVAATRRYIPWETVYVEQHTTMKEARRRELQLKSWKKRVAIEKLIKHFKISTNRGSAITPVGL